jgi:hypothetical protein
MNRWAQFPWVQRLGWPTLLAGQRAATLSTLPRLPTELWDTVWATLERVHGMVCGGPTTNIIPWLSHWPTFRHSDGTLRAWVCVCYSKHGKHRRECYSVWCIDCGAPLQWMEKTFEGYYHTHMRDNYNLTTQLPFLCLRCVTCGHEPLRS